MKKEIEKVVNNLANADLTFTTEDELEFCKKVLQAKEQECDNLKDVTENQRKENAELLTKLGEMVLKNDELCKKRAKYLSALGDIERYVQHTINEPLECRKILRIIEKVKAEYEV